MKVNKTIKNNSAKTAANKINPEIFIAELEEFYKNIKLPLLKESDLRKFKKH